LKYPRQTGHTTAMVELFKKYNAWYMYERQTMGEYFRDAIGEHRSDRIIPLSVDRGYKKGGTLIRPHVILIDNFSFVGADKVMNVIMDYIPQFKHEGEFKPIPLVCMG
jgi:hypothetical protein